MEVGWLGPYCSPAYKSFADLDKPIKESAIPENIQSVSDWLLVSSIWAQASVLEVDDKEREEEEETLTNIRRRRGRLGNDHVDEEVPYKCS